MTLDEDPVSAITSSGKCPDRKLDRVAEVHRAGQPIRRRHQSHQPVDKIVDIAERAGLAAVSVHGNVFLAQGLHDEVRHHTPIAWMHAGTISIENPCYLDWETMLAAIIEEQRLRAAVAFIIAGAHPDGIHIPPVVLLLRMHDP